MTLSALIISHRRPLWLKRCVESLVHDQNDPTKLRIEIAINGPDDESWQTASELVHRFPETVVRLERFGRSLTPAGARNAMIPKISSEWVLFIDDDAFIDPGYLECFHETLTRFPGATAIGGPNLTPRESSLFQKSVGETLRSRLATYCSVTRYRSSGEARPATDSDLILCNLFVRRGSLSEQSFPADFKCAEENWLLQTLEAQNQEIIYQPSLCVWHERRSGVREFAAQVHKYGFGRGQNIWRRPKTMRAAHLVPSLCFLILIGALPASLIFTWAAVLVLSLLSMYAGLCVLAAARVASSPRAFGISLFLFPLIHVAYGIGVIEGILESIWRGGEKA